MESESDECCTGEEEEKSARNPCVCSECTDKNMLGPFIFLKKRMDRVAEAVSEILRDHKSINPRAIIHCLWRNNFDGRIIKALQDVQYRFAEIVVVEELDDVDASQHNKDTFAREFYHTFDCMVVISRVHPMECHYVFGQSIDFCHSVSGPHFDPYKDMFCLAARIARRYDREAIEARLDDLEDRIGDIHVPSLRF